MSRYAGNHVALACAPHLLHEATARARALGALPKGRKLLEWSCRVGIVDIPAVGADPLTCVTSVPQASTTAPRAHRQRTLRWRPADDHPLCTRPDEAVSPLYPPTGFTTTEQDPLTRPVATLFKRGDGLLLLLAKLHGDRGRARRDSRAKCCAS
eukprot:scaffold4204_cov140-Isochrysis_galbana.AAC.6